MSCGSIDGIVARLRDGRHRIHGSVLGGGETFFSVNVHIFPETHSLSLSSNGWLDHFSPWNKATGAWSCPLTLTFVELKERVDLYLHLLLRPHDVHRDNRTQFVILHTFVCYHLLQSSLCSLCMVSIVFLLYDLPPKLLQTTVGNVYNIREKVIRKLEFNSKVHGKVCTTKNLISGHKMAP